MLQMQSAAEAEPSSDSASSGQERHAPWSLAPLMGLQVLLVQLISTPAEHHEPGGQGAQPSLLLRPSFRPTVPASHGAGDDEPSAHHDATEHVLHAVAPDSSCQLPAEHRRHVAMLASEA